ncbi:MAG: hypothetical protein ABI888_04085 [Chloroflexota bacterium]
MLIVSCGSSASGTPAAPLASASGPSGAFDCAFTKPRNATPPPLPPTRNDQNESVTRTGTPLFVHFNDTLAVRLPLDGTMLIGPDRDGVKLGWIRIKNGALAVTAKRLDVPERVEVDLADNYGDSGLQVTGIRFRAPGCYEVTGSVAGGPPLTFVTRVSSR